MVRSHFTPWKRPALKARGLVEVTALPLAFIGQQSTTSTTTPLPQKADYTERPPAHTIHYTWGANMGHGTTPQLLHHVSCVLNTSEYPDEAPNPSIHPNINKHHPLLSYQARRPQFNDGGPTPVQK